MKEIDVITKYLEALKTDIPDEQAKLFAKSWAEACQPHPDSASKHELQLSIEKINGTVGKLSVVIYTILIGIVLDLVKNWFIK